MAALTTTFLLLVLGTLYVAGNCPPYAQQRTLDDESCLSHRSFLNLDRLITDASGSSHETVYMSVILMYMHIHQCSSFDTAAAMLFPFGSGNLSQSHEDNNYYEAMLYPKMEAVLQQCGIVCVESLIHSHYDDAARFWASREQTTHSTTTLASVPTTTTRASVPTTTTRASVPTTTTRASVPTTTTLASVPTTTTLAPVPTTMTRASVPTTTTLAPVPTTTTRAPVPTTTTLASVPTTTTAAVTHPPVRCWVCSGLDCLLHPTSHTGQLCPTDQTFCMVSVTDLYYDRSITRRCTSASVCDILYLDRTRNNPECLDVQSRIMASNTQCDFCCTGDNCNKGPNLIPEVTSLYT